MRGSGGRDRALQAEEGHTSQQHSEASAWPSHPRPAGGSPLFHGVLPAKARATGQEGSPEGGVQFSDTAATCQQLSTNSGPRWKMDPLAFSCSLPSREADKETDWGGQGFSQGGLPRGVGAWAGS